MGQQSKQRNFRRIVELVPPEDSGLTFEEAAHLANSASEKELAEIRYKAELEFGEKK